MKPTANRFVNPESRQCAVHRADYNRPEPADIPEVAAYAHDLHKV